MKRTLLILVFSVVLTGGVFSQNFVMRSTTGLVLGSDDVFRGVGLGLQAQYNVFGTGIHLGVWSTINYDLWYGNLSLPVALSLGFGKNLYLLAGTTIDITPATDLVTQTRTTPQGFLNTFGIGVHLPLLAITEQMVFGTVAEITYTHYTADSTGIGLLDGLGMLGALFANFKANAMVSFEILF